MAFYLKWEMYDSSFHLKAIGGLLIGQFQHCCISGRGRSQEKKKDEELLVSGADCHTHLLSSLSYRCDSWHSKIIRLTD